jgi:hypothetical protein
MEADDQSGISYARLEQAIALWRSGDSHLQRWSPATRDAYEEAVGLGLVFLHRSATIPALLTAHFTPQTEMDSDWVKFVCHLTPFPLNRGLVEDAAYWRRAKQLITSHLGVLPPAGRGLRRARWWPGSIHGS